MPTRTRIADNGSQYFEVTPDDGLDVAVHSVRRFAHMALNQLRRLRNRGSRYGVKSMAVGAMLLGSNATRISLAPGWSQQRITRSPWVVGSVGTIVSNGERARALTVHNNAAPIDGVRHSRPKLVVDNTVPAPAPDEPEWAALMRWLTSSPEPA